MATERCGGGEGGRWCGARGTSVEAVVAQIREATVSEAEIRMGEQLGLSSHSFLSARDLAFRKDCFLFFKKYFTECPRSRTRHRYF